MGSPLYHVINVHDILPTESGPDHGDAIQNY